MNGFNRVLVIGTVVQPVELRHTPKGKPVTTLRLAVNEVRRDIDGNPCDETCYISCEVWGRSAELSADLLDVGSPAVVDGRLKLSQWEKNGKKHSRHYILADRVQALTPPARRAEPGDQSVVKSAANEIAF